jgi:oxygen-independent coproporphyrinogen-3 oxidase
MEIVDLIARYDGRVPRYTSYPTAPHFSAAFAAETYTGWLADLPEDAPVSLYFHVPFCDRLCLYCGCNTSVVRKEAPRRAYAQTLIAELRMVAAQIGRREVSHVHWGGGTPTTLPADCLVEIMDLVRSLFILRDDAEIAIELDPTALPADRLAALRGMGITRASLGVQDLDPDVQKAIGRMQSYEETAACADALRAIGITSLNLDLIYGLPNQTEESVTRTARRALDLGADRVAVFGYAHVPWMKRHQSLIPDNTLPGPLARFAQRDAIGAVLERQGLYEAVGLDHYARPGDALAVAATSQTLHRSFQGYTTDTAPVLIGLGASAIGGLPQGYVQNAPLTPVYTKAIAEGRFATVRGLALTPDDRLRRDVIERIMCDLTVDLRAVSLAHESDPAPLLDAIEVLAPMIADGLVVQSGATLTVTEAGRPFVRSVASAFDAYLKRDDTAPRHSSGV